MTFFYLDSSPKKKYLRALELSGGKAPKVTIEAKIVSGNETCGKVIKLPTTLEFSHLIPI